METETPPRVWSATELAALFDVDVDSVRKLMTRAREAGFDVRTVSGYTGPIEEYAESRSGWRPPPGFAGWNSGQSYESGTCAVCKRAGVSVYPQSRKVFRHKPQPPVQPRDDGWCPGSSLTPADPDGTTADATGTDAGTGP